VQLRAYMAAYEDSERTHALRSKSEAALKAELSQLQVRCWAPSSQAPSRTCCCTHPLPSCLDACAPLAGSYPVTGHDGRLK